MPRISSRTSACLLPRPFVCASPLISPARTVATGQLVVKTNSALAQDFFRRVDNPGHDPVTARPRLTLLAALAPVAVVAAVGTSPSCCPRRVHFGLVSAAAAITSVASLALSIAGARARDGRTRADGHGVLDDDRAVRGPRAGDARVHRRHERRHRPRRRPVGAGRRRPARADRAAVAAPPRLRPGPGRSLQGVALRRRAAARPDRALDAVRRPRRAAGQVRARRSACWSPAPPSSAS